MIEKRKGVPYLKKFILGLTCGLLIAGSSVAFASNSIQALLFPASFEINGSEVPLSSEYKVINVDGHAYVPIRFVAENLGATIGYDAELQKIIVRNQYLGLTDPDYDGISVGNLILTKEGNNTRVTGQLKMEGVGNTKNKLTASLSFYNDNSEKVGVIKIEGNQYGVAAQTFEAEASGDFREYATVNLRISSVNNKVIPAASTIQYKNTKYHFTLDLPKSWDGKYDVVEKVNHDSVSEYFDFIHQSSKQTLGGVIFTIGVVPRQYWVENGPTLIDVGQTSKIGEKEDKVFTLSKPGDVQFDPEDEKLAAEYLSMSKYINTIKTSLKFSN